MKVLQSWPVLTLTIDMGSLTKLRARKRVTWNADGVGFWKACRRTRLLLPLIRPHENSSSRTRKISDAFISYPFRKIVTFFKKHYKLTSLFIPEIWAVNSDYSTFRVVRRMSRIFEFDTAFLCVMRAGFSLESDVITRYFRWIITCGFSCASRTWQK